VAINQLKKKTRAPMNY